ncbi:MAG: dethiobiotin synthase [Deltaproteobacteria bacterium]|nr:dethiobiotin synthase [Deltaproteobacteria bacterium]
MNLFITGTGTDVGKTFLTCGLLRSLQRNCVPMNALKPVVSGFTFSERAQTDTGLLLRALNRPLDEESIEKLSPWRYMAPLSPDAAAAHEGRTLPFEKLIAMCKGQLTIGSTLIEGVGGVLVPLDDKRSVRDWISELDLPVLLVTRADLGTLSHTLCAAEALSYKGVKIRAVVVNDVSNVQMQKDAPAVHETVETLKRFLPSSIPTYSLRYQADAAAFDDLRDALFPSRFLE